jgi:choline dehydrogenase-like flavoprotein
VGRRYRQVRRLDGPPRDRRAAERHLRTALPQRLLTPPWGIPTLHIDCAWSDNELAMYEDMNVAAAELLEASGAGNIRPNTRGPSTPGNTNHEMGAARMGRDRRTSVLNGWNQAWDVPNLFVTDGACMTSSGNQNPSLTYMALTARACHYAVEQMRRGEI